MKTEETGTASFSGVLKREGAPNILSHKKGKHGVYVLIESYNENGTDAEVAKICLESYMRRPSLREQSLNMIGNFMNNMALAKRKPEVRLRQDAAALFVKGNRVRWLISGAAKVLLFSEGKLLRASDNKKCQRFGERPIFKAELEPVFALPATDNAAFLCTESILQRVSVSDLEQTLQSAPDAESWMQAVEKLCGETVEGSALAVMFPMKKRMPIWILLLLIVLLVLAVGCILHLFGVC